MTLIFSTSRVVITEVMANPAGASGAHAPEDRNEFVELYNRSRYAVDLAGWTINDGDATDQLVAWTDSSILRQNPAVRLGTTWLNPGCFAVVLDSEYTDPNPIGGYVQPYRFGPGALILTTGNTTIGNGLAGNDPLVLVASSAYGFEDTSTFGTPCDTTDSLPGDAGDGFSWERIRVEDEDMAGNWTRCLDSARCTPGSPNSIFSCLDLAVTELTVGESLRPSTRAWASVRVANLGFVSDKTWSLVLRLEPGERVDSLVGWELEPGEDSLLPVEFTVPRTNAYLAACLLCPADRDTLNNLRRVYLRPGGSDRLLTLDRLSFSPDGDGIEDTLVIVYRVAKTGGRLNVAVFDLAGREVRTICRDLTITEERGVLFWDGRQDRGDRLPAGIYAVWLEYREGGVSRTEKLPVALVRRGLR
ncbi:MAG: lamin tail domain-containing protein [candidate division WOR-3 bacterium]